MKGFFKYIAAAMAMSLLAIGCTPEVLTPDQNQLPEASSLEVVITPDQATNYVTFSVKNAQGIVPMWIFGEDKIDGKANKKFAYTGNDLVLRIREAGTHQVEVKAYNAHGVSVGSKIESYTLENTYRDPFDPTPYMKAMAGEWMWNSGVAGHFGCGEPGTDGLNWWSCGVNEKADWSLYDDRMTFTADGKYTYNPGDGQVYVNKDSGFKNEYNTNDGNDYLAPIDEYTVDYTIESVWNDAGIEEIYLVLPEGSNLSYIPNPEALTNPRWRFLETKTSSIKKNMSLVIDNGGIAWRYEFVPAVKTATTEELLAGVSAEGKAWVMDSAVAGHIGCGWDAENAAGWWAAGPDEKASFGMYDDVVTFFPDGKYKYETGADGKMYINKEVTKVGPGGATEDIDVDYPGIETTYTFDGEKIVLPEGTPMVYVSSDAIWDSPEFFVTELTETTLKVVTFKQTVGNPDGIAWQMIFKARDIQAGGDNGEGGEVEVKTPWDATTPSNLWLAAKKDNNFYYMADNGWAGIAYEEVEVVSDNEFVLTLPEGLGGSQWQGQFAFNEIGISTSADKKYDFQVVLVSSEDHPGVTIKLTDAASDDSYFCADRHVVPGGEEFVYQLSGVQGIDAADLDLFFDFGGGVGGSTVTIKNIIIREAQGAFDPTAANNLWLTAKKDNNFYYMADNGWAGIAYEEVEVISDNEFELTLPEGLGGSQWQGQFAFNEIGIATSADKYYGFQVVLVSSEDHPGITIKLTDAASDDSYFCADRHVVPGGEEFVYQLKEVKGIDAADLDLFFDFGGGVGGSTITIKDIVIIEY